MRGRISNHNKVFVITMTMVLALAPSATAFSGSLPGFMPYCQNAHDGKLSRGIKSTNQQRSLYKIKESGFINKWELFLHDEENIATVPANADDLTIISAMDEGDDRIDDDAPLMLENDNEIDEADMEEAPNEVINGTADGFIVTKTYTVPLEGFMETEDESTNANRNNIFLPAISTLFTSEDQERLKLESKNVTLPAALMLLDPETYPTQSKARKSIRQRAICISRARDTTGTSSSASNLQFKELGKVIKRIYPGDVIGFQRRAGSDYYAVQGVPYRLPPFEVPVIYEDDHMAIVNKPAGIVCYRAEGGRGGGARGGGHGRDTLLSALPYVLQPPKFTKEWGSKDGCNDDGSGRDDGNEVDDPRFIPLKRPQPVHRLDRPTSGCLVVAKTKAAAVHLAQQFEFRKARKTYMAIVNGIPKQGEATVNGDEEDETIRWNTIDSDLEEKSAITKWRVVRSVNSLHGRDGQLTLVEVKPKTGRYHQIRRHMAWICGSPLVGDTTYDDGDEDAMRLRKRGLFLCSNEIMVEHPYFNTPTGQIDWAAMKKNTKVKQTSLMEDADTGKIFVKARIELPEKFESFLSHESSRAGKFQLSESESD